MAIIELNYLESESLKNVGEENICAKVTKSDVGKISMWKLNYLGYLVCQSMVKLGKISMWKLNYLGYLLCKSPVKNRKH